MFSNKPFLRQSPTLTEMAVTKISCDEIDEEMARQKALEETFWLKVSNSKDTKLVASKLELGVSNFFAIRT